MLSNKLPLNRTASLLLTLFVTACGGGGGGGDNSNTPPPPDTTSPTANISFPPQQSITQAAEVTVRGSASDNVGVTNVTVNGVNATSDDNFATWSATIPLTQGANAITVSASDAAGNSAAASQPVQIHYQSRLLYRPSPAVFDSANNRLIVRDDGVQIRANLKNGLNGPALVMIDLASGNQTTLSDNATPNADNSFTVPIAHVLDSVNNRVIVVDRGIPALLAVDLNTGARTVISDPSITSDDPVFKIRDIQLDSANNRLLGITATSLLSVDLSTGVSTLISHETLPNATNPISYPSKMALDIANNRVLTDSRVEGTDTGVLAIDLSSGARTVISSATQPNATNMLLSGSADMNLDAANNRVLLADLATRSIYAVNLDTGERTILVDSSHTLIDRRHIPRSVLIDSNNNRALIQDRALKTVFAMDLTTGTLTTLTTLDVNSSDPDGYSGYDAIAYDSANKRAVLTRHGMISAVDANSGEQTLLFPDTMLFGSSTKGMTLDDQNNIILTERSIVQTTNINSAERTIVSNKFLPDAKNNFKFSNAVAFDSDTKYAYILDHALHAVFRVDMATGQRAILSDSTTPDAVNPLSRPWDVALDKANNRLLVLDTDLLALLAVNLDTGARTIISDNSTPVGNPLSSPKAIAFDQANNRVLVADSGLNAIIAISLSNGARTIVSDNTSPDSTNPVTTPLDMALDSANNRVLLVDKAYQGLLAVQLDTGVRTNLFADSVSDLEYYHSNFGDIVIDETNARAILSHGYEVLILYSIDLNTGAAQTILDRTDLMTQLSSIVVDNDNSRAIITSDNLDSVIAFDFNTAIKSMVSDDKLQTTDTNFSSTRGIVLDAANDRALVAARAGIFDIALGTGIRSIFSSDTIPDDVNPIDNPQGIAMDTANNRALILEEGQVLSMDLSTGSRTVLSGVDVPDNVNPFDILRAIAVDSDNNRALVLNAVKIQATNRYNYSVIAVDLTSGARTVLSDDNLPNTNNPFVHAQHMTIDTDNNRLLVTNDYSSEITAVDLVDGQRVILSR